MKRSTSSVLLLAGVFFLLVALNFLFLVDPRKEEETEQTGDRSSYRTTPYGTRAFYTFLEESGYPVTRFELPYTDLEAHREIGTLVLISPPLPYNPTPEEFESLNQWVAAGGLLVVIDREIVASFGNITAETSPRDPRSEVHPLQPTVYTRGIERLALSKLATRVRLEGGAVTYHVGDQPAGAESAVLGDARVGEGRVVCLTDPFVVANNGISEADNVVLALNLFADRPPGKIAFDEFHHGHGASGSGGFMSYFRPTPVPWILAHAALIGAVVVYTYGRRFARPLPLKRERRTTNLEFVSSMANITRLAHATDLAMQNIYSEFRRKLCRYGGVPAATDTRKLARVVAGRSELEERGLWRLLTRCETVARREQVSDAELLKLVSQVREIESDLNL